MKEALKYKQKYLQNQDGDVFNVQFLNLTK